MATDRGRWLVDQVPERLGACSTSFAGVPSLTSGAVSVFVAGTAVVLSERRPVVDSARLEAVNWRETL
jgi:hypothetical protein